MDTLSSLFAETSGRQFDAGALQQLVNTTKEGYQKMLVEPGTCFRCGTLALENVAKQLKVLDFDIGYVRQVSSPVQGFNMTALSELALKEKVNLVPVAATNLKSLVVPSVIHWKQQHYAAVVEEKAGRYRVIDPTFGAPLWLKFEDIQDEASGYFMVPKDKLPEGWRLLAKNETDKVYGRGSSTV